MTWRWALSTRIAGKAPHGQGQEAVEIGENRRSFTLVVWDGNEVERKISR